MTLTEAVIALSPKRAFHNYCDHHDIEVEHLSLHGGHHVHVYAPSGQRFSGHQVGNLGLWDSYRGDGAPDWRYCLKEVERSMPLEPDPDYEEDTE